MINAAPWWPRVMAMVGDAVVQCDPILSSLLINSRCQRRGRMYLCCLTTIYYLLYLLFVNVIIKVLKLTQWLHILRPKSNCFLMMTRRRWDKTTHAPSSGPDHAHCSLAGWERESWDFKRRFPRITRSFTITEKAPILGMPTQRWQVG